MTSALNGHYAYRFNGFDDAGKASYFLLGVGVMDLEDGKVTGQHRSSIMPLGNGVSTAAQLGGLQVLPAKFTMSGTYGESADQPGIWDFNVTFRCEDPVQVMQCGFAFVPAGPGVLWIVSQGSEVLGPKGAFVKVAEMSMGEAVRVS